MASKPILFFPLTQLHLISLVNPTDQHHYKAPREKQAPFKPTLSNHYFLTCGLHKRQEANKHERMRFSLYLRAKYHWVHTTCEKQDTPMNIFPQIPLPYWDNGQFYIYIFLFLRHCLTFRNIRLTKANSSVTTDCLSLQTQSQPSKLHKVK